MNLEFSTINFIVIQVSVGFTSIQRGRIRQVMLMLVPLLGIQSRSVALPFSKIRQNFCLTLNSRVAQSVHIQANKHCVFQKAVNPSAGLKCSPWERSLGWQYLFGLTVLLGEREQATSNVSPLVVDCGVS